MLEAEKNLPGAEEVSRILTALLAAGRRDPARGKCFPILDKSWIWGFFVLDPECPGWKQRLQCSIPALGVGEVPGKGDRSDRAKGMALHGKRAGLDGG